jgi:hypothetical protein
VSYQNVLKLVLLEDFVVDIENCAAGIAEHMFDSFFSQATADNFRASEFLGRGFQNLRVKSVHDRVLSRCMAD